MAGLAWARWVALVAQGAPGGAAGRNVEAEGKAAGQVGPGRGVSGRPPFPLLWEAVSQKESSGKHSPGTSQKAVAPLPLLWLLPPLPCLGPGARGEASAHSLPAPGETRRSSAAAPEQPRLHSGVSSAGLSLEGGKLRFGAPGAPTRDPAMGRGCPLWHTAALGWLFTAIIITFRANPALGQGLSIALDEKGRSVTLHCKGSNNITWKKNGIDLSHEGEELPLGSAMDDPRGVYTCYDKDAKNASLQVFFRMCQNCVHLDVSTILGITSASLLATLFLAFAVYCMAVEEPSQRSQASDKQNLLANDQLYQPLGERNNGQYSHIGVAKTRHR